MLALVAVVVLAGASIAIAARGGDEENDDPAGTNLTAIRCPLEPTGKTDAGGSPSIGPRRTRSTPPN